MIYLNFIAKLSASLGLLGAGLFFIFCIALMTVMGVIGIWRGF